MNVFTGWIDHGSRRIGRAAALVLLAAVIGLAGATAASAGAGFPFVDRNDNGVYDPGIDSGDITADLLAGKFSTPDSVVIPADAKPLSTKSLAGFAITAGKSITVLASLTVATDGGVVLVAEGGEILVGDKKGLKGGFIRLEALGNVVLGKGAQLDAKGGPVMGTGDVLIHSAEGDVLVLGGARITARDDVDITAFMGGVTVGPAAQITAKNGLLNIHAEGTISIIASKLRGQAVNLFTFGDWLEVRSDTVRVGSDGWISVLAYGPESTIDCSGTRWEGVPEGNLLVSADVIIDK